MTNTNITTLRKNIFAMFEQAVKFNQPINVSTKHGNAIILSEEDYNSILATIEVLDNKYVVDDIMAGINTPLSECIEYSDKLWEE